MRSTHSLVLVALLALGCAGTLPEPIYANQVEEYFPESEGSDPAVREEARQCAARLNGHRSSAEVSSIVQSIISGIGSVTGGVGSALTSVDFDNEDITTAMAVMGTIGAGVTIVGNLIMGLFANPLEELRRHSLGLRSWEVAVELRYGGGDPAAIRQALERCQEDEPPPARVPGEGPAFSM